MNLTDVSLHFDQGHIHIATEANGKSFYRVEAERGVKRLTGKGCHQLKLTETRRECGSLALCV